MPSEFSLKLQQELEEGLRALEARSQRRTLVELSGVNFCSNDYLRLAENAELKRAVVVAMEEAARVGGTGSRLLSGNFAIWEEVEAEFAEFAGTEAALYFGSGYAANVGLLSSLLGKGALVFSDRLNHASIIDGIRLSGARKVIYPHLDLNALESELRAHADERGRKLIVTETVFSMDGDVAPMGELVALAERYGAGLIADEAHATAVHGPSGRGITAKYGAVRSLTGIVHTCGKALASAGAFVCGSGVLREHLINHARTFIFSTAMPTYMAGQIRAGLRLAMRMDAERVELQTRAECFTSGLRAQGWDTRGSSTQIVPVMTGGNDETIAAAEFLQREGFAVRGIRPPTVAEGEGRLRLSLTCAIAKEELARLEKCLNVWRETRCGVAAAGRG
jgi:8-amino-7-oxononanoate synthase